MWRFRLAQYEFFRNLTVTCESLEGVWRIRKAVSEGSKGCDSKPRKELLDPRSDPPAPYSNFLTGLQDFQYEQDDLAIPENPVSPP